LGHDRHDVNRCQSGNEGKLRHDGGRSVGNAASESIQGADLVRERRWNRSG
jgi:hypothetical protein